MRFILMLVIACFCFLSSPIFAEPKLIHFQILSDELVLDKDDVVQATISPQSDGNMTTVKLELTPYAELKLNKMTGQNISRRMNLVLGNVIVSTTIIQTEVGGKFFVSCTKEQAKEIVATYSH